ncbi:Uncharacterised protein [Providencia stuartii]|nr:Uncharacterised protein [Providencia stuartii]
MKGYFLFILTFFFLASYMLMITSTIIVMVQVHHMGIIMMFLEQMIMVKVSAGILIFKGNTEQV